MEFPAIRPALIGGMGLVFLLCFSSFALVLMLGGGPRITTLEVEIYSAIRFEFDFGKGAVLALVQCISALLVVALLTRIGGGSAKPGFADALGADSDSGDDGAAMRPFTDALVVDCLALATFAVLVILPVVAVIAAGVGPALAEVIAHPRFLPAARTSLGIACLSALAAIIMGITLAHARVRVRERRGKAPQIAGMVIDSGVMLYLVLPSIVFATAAFIVLGAGGDAFYRAFPVVVLANTLLALPFAVRICEGRMRRIYPRHDPLATALGIIGAARWRILTLPAMRREMGIVIGLAAAMSLGDLGVIALFAGDGIETLPWLLYRMAGRYQADEAQSLALILLVLALMLLFIPYYFAKGKNHA